MRNKYAVSELVSTLWALIMTKLSLRQARLVRRPVYIRGKGSIIGAKGLTTGHFCRFDLDGNEKTLSIGDNCEIGDMCHIVALRNVSLGNNVLVASKVFISDTNHGTYSGDGQDAPDSHPNDRPLTFASVSIGDRVWIGENAVILAGSRIGDGCIIGANAVVKGVWPENSIIAGAPAVLLKKFNAATRRWERAKA